MAICLLRLRIFDTVMIAIATTDHGIQTESVETLDIDIGQPRQLAGAIQQALDLADHRGRGRCRGQACIEEARDHVPGFSS